MSNEDRFGEAFDAVLAAAQTGAPWALERIYRAFAPAVAGYLRTQGSGEPDDVTSEVFIGAFRTLSSFNGGEGQFRSWLFTIAHRRLLDERRQLGRRATIVDSWAETPDAPALHDAEGEAMQLMASQRVRRLCERLVADQRDVLLLRLVGGLTVEEVATALDKSSGAVKALQRRGLTALRKILESEGVPL
ncbi:MAG: RNA polymerase sigma factor [Actinomycetota bacterium]|nr:RNA polymerase sigma factor [Actinomycetota bacterium]